MPNAAARLRRFGPEAALVLVVGFAGVSVWQGRVIASHLRAQARETARIYGRITAALADSTPGVDTETLLTLVAEIRASGLPLVVTDTFGRATASANLPFDTADGPKLREALRAFDRVNPPLTVAPVGTLHFGALPMARRLRWLEWFQVGLLVTAVAVGAWAYRNAVHRHRDRLWVAVARESAHQLGTPLMSIGAWVDRLEAGSTSPGDAAAHLRADVERLERVAKRFERIGRPAARDRVAVGAVAERVAGYFTPRLPRHAHAIRIVVDAPESGPYVRGDAVLIEWALEVLVRNSVDALSGRGGTIQLAVAGTSGHAALRVTDDGPGIPPEVRSTLFEPGVTTKTGGWGIGLALAKRIVEDVHGGRLSLGPAARGAEFVITLPLAERRPGT